LQHKSFRLFILALGTEFAQFNMPSFLKLLALLASAAAVNAAVLPTTSDDNDDTPLPLVIWHGLGDNYAADGIKSVGDLAEEVNPGTLVYNVRIDDDANSDKTATFFGNLTLQSRKSAKTSQAILSYLQPQLLMP